MYNLIHFDRSRNGFPDTRLEQAPEELTNAGRIVWYRLRRPPATCNAIAEMAGLGGGRGK